MILLATALAADKPLKVDLHGDVKSFFTATFPYDHTLMPENPTGSGVADFRLKLSASYRDRIELVLHHTTTALTASPATGGLGTSTGVGLQAPEVVDLSWVAFDEDLTLRGRVDRAFVAWKPDGMALTVGRQPITFGNAAVFTPLDLVNPFNPAVIDQEYKPGVDAVRVDLYHGFATKLTLAAAYAGSWEPEGLILAAYGQTTVGVTDLGLFVGSVRRDAVLGGSVVTSVGPVGLTSDVAVTLPAVGDPYLRATLGTLWRPTTTTTVTAEAYVQTLGSTKPANHLQTTTLPAFQRNEIWLMGVLYASVAVSQEITPTVSANVAVVGNLLDPSAFVAPSLAWSVAGNVDLAVGGFVGVGKRPRELTPDDLARLAGGDLALDYLGSEFGTYPGVAFVQVRTYF